MLRMCSAWNSKLKMWEVKSSNITSVDCYKDYMKHLELTPLIPKSQKEKYRVSKVLYTKIINRAVELIIAEVLSGRGFLMPYKLGKLLIDKKKNVMDMAKLRVDWKLTIEHNMKIFHLNQHTNGYYFRFRWDKVNAVVPNKSRWSFAASRLVKAKLSNVVRAGKTFVSYGH